MQITWQTSASAFPRLQITVSFASDSSITPPGLSLSSPPCFGYLPSFASIAAEEKRRGEDISYTQQCIKPIIGKVKHSKTSFSRLRWGRVTQNFTETHYPRCMLGQIRGEKVYLLAKIRMSSCDWLEPLKR